MRRASRTLSVTIECAPEKVSAFVSDPRSLAKWAAGLGSSIRESGAGWVVDSPQGLLKLRFAQMNEFGVLDHYVTLPSGADIYVPMRVLKYGAGSEVIFTLLRLHDMSDEQFDADAAAVDRKS